jgi:soluble lytic murein transglycosylase-like protein
MVSAPASRRRDHAGSSRLVKLLGSLAVLAAVAACSTSQDAAVDQSREAALYQAHARGNYLPPGPPADPWGPYVTEASARFDVPQRWIRQVMHQESGGQLYQAGQLITSRAGAMGLMQVMPETYDELRVRYDLDEDAYDPHNNVLAGAAYLREMYDIYGSPGFLAAYNAGPKRLDDYLANLRPLPDETRRYVANIAPYIEGTYPANRSPAEQYAMNMLPDNIPPGLRYGGRGYAVAEARTAPVRTVRAAGQYAARQYAARSERAASRAERQYAAKEKYNTRAPVQLAFAEMPPSPPPPPSGKRRVGFGLIQPAMAETVPSARGNGWGVQVGAYGSAAQASAATGAAREQVGGRATVTGVKQGKETLYRARVGGLSKEAAVSACRKLAKGKGNCMVVAPNS